MGHTHGIRKQHVDDYQDTGFLKELIECVGEHNKINKTEGCQNQIGGFHQPRF